MTEQEGQPSTRTSAATAAVIATICTLAVVVIGWAIISNLREDDENHGAEVQEYTDALHGDGVAVEAIPVDAKPEDDRKAIAAAIQRERERFAIDAAVDSPSWAEVCAGLDKIRANFNQSELRDISIAGFEQGYDTLLSELGRGYLWIQILTTC
jgi:hypothetical protein